ncbi:MAG TPA: PASTA domain-containing protein [Candidatus Goldiibacteriota bacterium]|nr:PASTA domain-containing protein [Candidatus Goldiibacteriota bacterium]
MEKIKISYIFKLVFLGIIISGVTALTIMKLMLSISVIYMPDLRGLQIEQAKKVTSKLGLELKVENEVDSNLFEKGTVISQDTPPKSKIKKGRIIYVVVSRGSQIIQMPDVTGLPVQKAVVELKNKNLDTGLEAVTSSFVFGENVIISQSPPPGANVPTGTKINLLKSSGARKFSFMMPDFRNQDIKNVFNLLKKYDLHINSLDAEDNDILESGTIIRQTPLSGCLIDKETQINFVVSKKQDDANLKKRFIKINYTYESDKSSLIKIIVLSLNGSEVLYNEITQPNKQINLNATVCGDAIVQIYEGTNLIKQIEYNL